MTNLLLGALIMANVIAGLFFLRFWKSTKDGFFLVFAISFWIQAAHWVIQALMNPASEHVPLLYAMRLLAFGVILFAIVNKNWPNNRST